MSNESNMWPGVPIGDWTALVFWTVCKNPSDFPHSWTVRPSWFLGLGRGAPQGCQLDSGEVRHATHPLHVGPVAVGPDLAAVRSLLPRGLHRLPRQPEDDPVIYEVWL